MWRFGNDRRSDQLRAADARPEVIDHVHRSFAESLRALGRTRIVEKTPANTVRPAFVEAVFPDARFVHITRDGWAAVPSISAFASRRASGFDARQVRKLRRRLQEAELVQMRHYVPELARRAAGRLGRRAPLYGPRLAGLRLVVDELGPLEAAALQWRTCIDAATVFGRSLPSARYLEVRLEQLDVTTMAQVLEFCDLPASSEVLDGFHASYRSNEGRARRDLSEAERAILAPYIEPANAWLGYPTSAERTAVELPT